MDLIIVTNTPSEKEATVSLKNKTENKAKSEQFSQARSTAIMVTVEKSLQEPHDSPEQSMTY